MTAAAGVCYLLHFSQPFPTGPAQHYLGWTPRDVAARLADHRAGSGARIVAAAVGYGLAVELVRVWPNSGRKDERRLKNKKNAPRLCPACRAARKAVTS